LLDLTEPFAQFFKKEHMKIRTSFPGWPGTFKQVSFVEWKAGMKIVPAGTGLLSSSVAPLPEGPHPQTVKDWRNQINASVSDTARHFGLEEVQILEATGR
jgi:hypothetical protein